MVLMLFRNEVYSHLFITFVYFLLVSVLHWKIDLNLLWLWLGALAGTFLLDIDHLIYWFISHPEEEDSRQARVLLKTENFKGLYLLLKRTHEWHDRLIFHTATFQIILLILSFYVLTSGGSFFGSALVLSMNLHLLKDEWFDFLGSRKAELGNWLFWQIKELTIERYLDLYLVGVTLAFLVLTTFFR